MQSEKEIDDILVEKYGKYMRLEICINKDKDSDLYSKYEEHALNHNRSLLENHTDFITRTFDLLYPGNETFSTGISNILDYKIVCSSSIISKSISYSCAFYINQSSNLGLTPLRLSVPNQIINPTRIIKIKVAMDVLPKMDGSQLHINDYKSTRLERYIHISAPELCPILIEIKNASKFMDDIDTIQEKKYNLDECIEVI